MEDIEEMIRRVIGGGFPSQEFRERLKSFLLAEVKAKRTKQLRPNIIEAVINRAISDLKFRRSLLENPEKATREAGFILSPAELAAFSDINEEIMESFGGELDQRISKRISKDFTGGPDTGA